MPKGQFRFPRKTQENHGLTGSSEYRIWASIKQRATDRAKGDTRRYYFGRGIVLCEEWSQSFAAFLEHVGPRPSPSHSIDRIDNEKGYEPGNVRWATPCEQGRNTRRNKLLTLGGKTMSLTEWADRLGINQTTIRMRLQTPGWTVEQALAVPVRRQAGGPTPWRDSRRKIALAALRRCVKAGTVAVAATCEDCSAATPLEPVHHRGYGEIHWLDVKWLCRPCRKNAKRQKAARRRGRLPEDFSP